MCGGDPWLSLLCLSMCTGVSVCLSMCFCQFCLPVLMTGFLWYEKPLVLDLCPLLLETCIFFLCQRNPKTCLTQRAGTLVKFVCLTSAHSQGSPCVEVGKSWGSYPGTPAIYLKCTQGGGNGSSWKISPLLCACSKQPQEKAHIPLTEPKRKEKVPLFDLCFL